jgi:dolichyl-phosphate-mannose--protein O-mannosyl transferase
MCTVERGTTVLLATMLVGGICLRIQGVGYPPWYTFDEEQFGRNAHHYLVGLPDDNDHPPLGKLFLGAGLLLFGYNSLGWRFVPLCFGLFLPVVAGWLGRALFHSRRAGWMAAAFVAADGSFLAYSRAGLLDGVLTCLVLWSMLAAVTARSPGGVLGAAVLAGLATSVKWSGVMAVIPAAIAVLALGRTSKFALLWLLAVPIVHVVLWTAALGMTEGPCDPGSVSRVMIGLFHHHIALGKNYNGLASPWYSWPVLYRPFMVKLSPHGLMSQYASSVSNPVLCLTASLALVLVPLGALIATIRARWRRRWRDVFEPPTTRAGLLLALGWLALWFPWMVGRGRYTFSYHYLPAYGFALVFLAGYVANLEKRHPRVALGFVALALAVAAHFMPVWSEFALTRAEAQHRLLFAPWRFPFPVNGI